MANYKKALPEEKVACVPLYRPVIAGHPQELESVASAVLLTYGNRHFLGTAGHVFRDRPLHELLVGGCLQPFFVCKEFQRNTLQDGFTADTDPVDFAAAELTRDEAMNLTTMCKFVSLDPSTPYQPFSSRFSHQFTGYVARDNCQRGTHTLTANLLRIEARDERRFILCDSRLRTNEHWYIGGKFDPQRDEVIEKIPLKRDLVGMSGGAIFLGEPYLSGVFHEFGGILIEARFTTKGAVHLLGIGTRAIIDMLHRWYPGLPTPVHPVKSLRLRSRIL